MKILISLAMLVVMNICGGCVLVDNPHSPYVLPIRNNIEGTYLVPSVSGYQLHVDAVPAAPLLEIPFPETRQADLTWQVGGQRIEIQANVYDIATGEYLGFAVLETYFEPYYLDFSNQRQYSPNLPLYPVWVVNSYNQPTRRPPPAH
jgi:hypothetical protein